MLALVNDRAAIAMLAVNVVLIGIVLVAAGIEWVMPRRRPWLIGGSVIIVVVLASNVWHLSGQLAA